MRGLLKHTIDRLDALEKYYSIFYKKIIDESGQKALPNKLGYSVDLLFRSIANGTFETNNSDPYLKFKESILEEVEIKNVQNTQDENQVKIEYRFKNPEKLTEQGIELNINKAISEFTSYTEMPIIFSSSVLLRKTLFNAVKRNKK